MAHDACPDENYQVACLDEYYQEQLPIIEQRICSSAGNEIRRYVMTNPDHRAVFSSFIHDDAAWASVSENLRNLLRYEITMSFFTEKALNQTYMFPDAVTYIEERSAQLASATTELPGTGDLEFEQATDGSRVEGGELACLAFLNDPEKFKACQKTKFRHNSRLR